MIKKNYSKYWYHPEYTPELKINKHGSGKWPIQGEWKFKVCRYVLHQQSNAPHKILILQEVQFLSGPIKGEKQIRIGYYIKGKLERMKGRWVWGQFAPLIPKKDFNSLIVKAKAKKIL